MSAFEALRILRIHQESNPEIALPELAQLIISVQADAGALDFEAAYVLAETISPDVSTGDGIRFYQHCIDGLILKERQIWAKIITLGRQKFTQKLSRDERQCFREAGLLLTPASLRIIAWWDRITGEVRLAADLLRIARSRRAERLTLDHETKRLRELGIDRDPIWIAIEDNTAGYDVISYDLGPIEPLNRLIEVKSTIASPLRFQLSRNEWNQACRFGERYHFHIWNLQTEPPQLFERTVADILPHVPTDNELGHWRIADIPVGS